MKGISLPINAIVVVAVAVLVLVVIAAFFAASAGSGMTTITHQQAWDKGCSQIRAKGCLTADFAAATAYEIDNYDIDGDGEPWNTILDACHNVYGTNTDSDQCRTLCCGA